MKKLLLFILIISSYTFSQWKSITPPLTGHPLNSVSFNNNIGVITGIFSSILISKDGGFHWSLNESFSNFSFYSSSVIDNTIWIAGGKSLK